MTTRVKVNLGYTVNMGNFESLRLDLGIEDDSREGETAQQALNRVYGFVEKNLIDKVSSLREELKEGNAGGS